MKGRRHRRPFGRRTAFRLIFCGSVEHSRSRDRRRSRGSRERMRVERLTWGGIPLIQSKATPHLGAKTPNHPTQSTQPHQTRTTKLTPPKLNQTTKLRRSTQTTPPNSDGLHHHQTQTVYKRHPQSASPRRSTGSRVIRQASPRRSTGSRVIRQHSGAAGVTGGDEGTKVDRLSLAAAMRARK